MRATHLFLISLTCVHLYHGQQLKTHVVRQVFPRFPDDLARCSLSKAHLSVINKLTCLEPCLALHTCRLYCLRGPHCYFYSAYVHAHYKQVDGLTLTFDFTECYTLTHYPRDYTGTIASIATNGTPYRGWGLPERAILGYFCYNPLGTCFLPEMSTFEYLSLNIDLGEVRNVTRVEFMTASRDIWGAPNTQNVRVRLGSDSAYINNSVYAYFAGEVPRAEVVSLGPGTTGLSGRFLQLVMEKFEAYFGVCNLRVLGW